MATRIGNGTEAASLGPQPPVEGAQPTSGASRNLSGDEQAFAAALRGQPGAEKAGMELLPKGAEKPQRAEPQAPVRRGETPPPQPTDGFDANGAEKTPTALSTKQADKLLLRTEPQAPVRHGETPPSQPTDGFDAKGDSAPDARVWPERLTAAPQVAAGVPSPERSQAPIPSREAAALSPPSSALPVIDPRREPPAARVEPTPSNALTANPDRESVRRRSGDSEPIDDQANPTPTAALAPGDSILRSLQGNPDSEPAAAPVASDAKLSEIAEKVAARILVADRSTDAPEVRITLNESFLNGAEVRVRQDGGRLVVELSSPSPETQALLRERGNDLRQALQERLGGEARVEIRSQDGGRDHSDGRSRQQRSAQDEWEAER